MGLSDSLLSNKYVESELIAKLLHGPPKVDGTTQLQSVPVSSNSHSLVSNKAVFRVEFLRSLVKQVKSIN